MNKIMDLTPQNLAEVTSFFAEALLDLDQSKYLADEGIWDGLFLLDSEERTRVRESFLFVDYEAPFKSCRIKIEGIQSCHLTDSSCIGLYSFELLSLNEDRLQMVFVENMNIIFVLSERVRLSIECQDTPTHLAQFRYYKWTGWERGPFDIKEVHKDRER